MTLNVDAEWNPDPLMTYPLVPSVDMPCSARHPRPETPMSSSTIRRIFATAAILLLGCSLSGCFYPGYGNNRDGDYRRGDGHSERHHRGDGGDNGDGGGSSHQHPR